MIPEVWFGTIVQVTLTNQNTVITGKLMGIGKHGVVVDATATAGTVVFFPWHAVLGIAPLRDPLARPPQRTT